MADARLVGLVVSTQANFVYFTGLRFDPLWSSATRSMIAVIPADGPLHLCLPAFVADEAEETWPDAVVHRYDVPPESVVPHVIDAIGALPTGPIGLELGREARTGVTPADFFTIVGHVDNLQVVDGQDLLWSLRTVKSSYEIACLRPRPAPRAQRLHRHWRGPSPESPSVSWRDVSPRLPSVRGLTPWVGSP